MPNILLFINVQNNNFIINLVQLQALFKKNCVAQANYLVEIDVHNSYAEMHSYFSLWYRITDLGQCVTHAKTCTSIVFSLHRGRHPMPGIAAISCKAFKL